ncbi:MAG: toxin-antitoxin system HicB family antitoxin [Thermoanaerobaculia bacterium]|nr:toxin-antitoxin system HicB family antitoxin [Thermoanaerobaculia bacterium]
MPPHPRERRSNRFTVNVDPLTHARLTVLAAEAGTSLSAFALEILRRAATERGAADRLAEQTHATTSATLQLLVRLLERSGADASEIRDALEQGLAHGLSEAREITDPVASFLSREPVSEPEG